MTLFTISLVLFMIMDPIGNISSYLSLMKEVSPKRKYWVLFREMLIVLLFMVAFNFLGEYIFDLLELKTVTVQLSSGLILFFTALKFLFPAKDSIRANLPGGEPFIIPLAIPLIAGPSLLATIMLFARLEPSIPLMLQAIFIAWVCTIIVLLAAPFLYKTLGNNGLIACERLMAMILLMMAIQRFMEGIKDFAVPPPLAS